MKQVNHPFLGDKFPLFSKLPVYRETKLSYFFVEGFRTRKMSLVLICFVNNARFTWTTYSEIFLAQLID